MANALNKTTLEYVKSINTPDYPETDWIIDPDMSGVSGIPHKYWKLVGNAPVEMTEAEKDAVDDAELDNRKALADNYNIDDMKIILTALVKVINLRLPANQKITKEEMVDALKAEIV